ncbi:MAG: hypothetical protein ACTIH8_06620, partial [Microbacterium gubbeenense]
MSSTAPDGTFSAEDEALLEAVTGGYPAATGDLGSLV